MQPPERHRIVYRANREAGVIQPLPWKTRRAGPAAPPPERGGVRGSPCETQAASFSRHAVPIPPDSRQSTRPRPEPRRQDTWTIVHILRSRHPARSPLLPVAAWAFYQCTASVNLVFTHGKPSLPSIAATSVTADFPNPSTPISSLGRRQI